MEQRNYRYYDLRLSDVTLTAGFCFPDTSGRFGAYCLGESRKTEGLLVPDCELDVWHGYGLEADGQFEYSCFTSVASDELSKHKKGIMHAVAFRFRDKAYLISDRAFAGSDVQATSYALSCGIARTGPFDLILCGKQTTDGDTAQVGPELAESLGIEHASGVLSIDGITEESITVTVNLDRVLQKQEMRLPCLLTIEKDAFTPRLPSFRRKFATGDDAVSVLTADDLPELDRTRCGLKGSPTQVEKIFPPEIKKDKKLFEGDGKTLAASLYGLLSSEKYL